MKCKHHVPLGYDQIHVRVLQAIGISSMSGTNHRGEEYEMQASQEGILKGINPLLRSALGVPYYSQEILFGPRTK